MANITVSVPDEVYRQARITAAKRGRSVSALVAELLGKLGAGDQEFDRLLAQQDQVISAIGQFRASDRLGREELHHRAIR